ncbi:MAG TPA: cytochrome c [Saprospiraceae bacterium]|nr:cytochrome c [Saprospiraceae bacterium]
MKTPRIALFLLMCLSLLIYGACKNNKEDEKQKQYVVHDANTNPTTTGPVTLTVEEFEGMKLFMRHCNKCHPGGEQAKGPSLNDKNVPNFLVHWQVRLGGGDMPKFTDEQISKEQLKQIVAFVSLMQSMTKE